MPRPAYTALGEAIASVMDAGGITTVALAERLRERGWKSDQSLISKWRHGHARPHDLDMYPDIEDICGVPRGTILRLAGYVEDEYPDELNRTDPDEMAIWRLEHIPESARWELINQLREINATPPPPRKQQRRRRKSA